MKRVILANILCLTVLSVVLFSAGCDENRKLTPQQLTELAGQVESLTNQLTVYQSQVTQLAGRMQADGILSDEDAAKVATLNSEIDRVKEKIAPIAAAIKAGTYNPDDDVLITILKAAAAANSATVGFNPYATYISIGLSAIIFILGLFAKKKSAEATVKDQALAEVVVGNEQLKRYLQATGDQAALNAFSQAMVQTQSKATEQIVYAKRSDLKDYVAPGPLPPLTPGEIPPAPAPSTLAKPSLN